MKLWIGITDKAWFQHLAQFGADEVNFWQPSGSREFRVLQAGEPFLFKLHAPDNFIVGSGYLARMSRSRRISSCRCTVKLRTAMVPAPSRISARGAAAACKKGASIPQVSNNTTAPQASGTAIEPHPWSRGYPREPRRQGQSRHRWITPILGLVVPN